jgi:hypothetical protein
VTPYHAAKEYEVEAEGGKPPSFPFSQFFWFVPSRYVVLEIEF